MSRLRIGMGQPYVLRATVAAGPDFDPTAVTGATFYLTKPSGTVVTKTGAVDAADAASATAIYRLAANGLDLDEAGLWRFWVQWTVPAQTPGPRTEVSTFVVVASDGV